MKNSQSNSFIFSILILLLFCSLALAQDTKPDDEVIKVDTLLLNIPVIVSDKDGRYIGGLKKESFYILENNIKRPVDFFADNSAPMNVAILVDTSGSTSSFLDEIKDAARKFISVLKPEDKVMVASFATATMVYSDFTSDRKQLEKAINKIKGGGSSNLYDSIYIIMKKYFAPIKGRKAIIVLTDGVVGGLGVPENVLFRELSESDIMIYPLLFSVKLPKFVKRAQPDKIADLKLFGFNKMNNLSTLTGGKLFDSSESDFKTSFENIADELKKQYIIGFYPTPENKEKDFKVGLHIDPKTYKPGNIVLRTKRVIRFKQPKMN